jgi:hypothetical protein
MTVRITSKSKVPSRVLRSARVSDGAYIKRGGYAIPGPYQPTWWFLVTAAGEQRALGNTAARALVNLRAGNIFGVRVEVTR